MSGGSFNYLCHKYLEDFFTSNRTLMDLDKMVEALEAFDYAADAAEDTRNFKARILEVSRGLEEQRSRLEDVWQAVEWIESGDAGQGTLKEAITAYRKKQRGF